MMEIKMKTIVVPTVETEHYRDLLEEILELARQAEAAPNRRRWRAVERELGDVVTAIAREAQRLERLAVATVQ